MSVCHQYTGIEWCRKTAPWPLSAKTVPNNSQGSVATRMQSGGMLRDDFITDLLPSPTVKEA